MLNLLYNAALYNTHIQDKFIMHVLTRYLIFSVKSCYAMSWPGRVTFHDLYVSAFFLRANKYQEKSGFKRAETEPLAFFFVLL